MNNNLIMAKKALERNGFKVEVFNDPKEVKEMLMNVISVDETIGLGGSVTLSELGIYESFKESGYNIYWHWKGGDKKQELNNAYTADVYIASTNGITLDGKLVNVDGVGNRASSMFYGHERVYIIAGKNKICKDYEEARNRIKEIAAPKNAQRLGISTPCSKTGNCNDCSSIDRICNVEVIIHRNPTSSNINIFLIDEELGY